MLEEAFDHFLIHYARICPLFLFIPRFIDLVAAPSKWNEHTWTHATIYVHTL